MNLSHIIELNGFRPLKTSLPEISHITIETNQTCNLNCRTCYNLYQDTVKTLDQIKEEIDFALTKRNLETITIIGGEPTLYSDLVEVITYIKEKDLIGKYKTAGLDRVLLHIDAGQNYTRGKINDIIDLHFRQLQDNRIYFALSITIYGDNAGIIPQIIRTYAKYSFFDGILATIERDTRIVFYETYKGTEKDSLELEYNNIRSQLDIIPTTYLPASTGDEEISWLIYFFYTNANSGYCYSASRTINYVFRKLYRFVKGKEFFATTIPPGMYLLNIIVSILLEFLFNPLRLNRLRYLVKSSDRLKAIRYHYIVIQDGPYFDKKKNALRLCYHCPDATIRNGKITPVCVADLINPIDRSKIINEKAHKVLEDVYMHLGELK
jgi:hypothetical protein